MEQSRNRFTLQDIHTAAYNLGFGSENALRLDYDNDIEDDFVENAWRDIIKRSNRDPDNAGEIHRRANESLRILAESRNSVRLIDALEKEKNKMTPKQAYETLEVPPDTEDSILITVFNMRVSLSGIFLASIN